MAVPSRWIESVARGAMRWSPSASADVPLHRGDLPTGARRAILRQLGVRPEVLEPEEWPMLQRSPCAYRTTLTPEPEGGFTVTFPDVPEAITCGADEREAMEMASDVLELAIVARVERSENLPSERSGAPGDLLVPLRPLGAKAALYDALSRGKVSKSELARRLGVDEAIVRRMARPRARDPRRQLGRRPCRLGPASSGDHDGGPILLALATDGKPTLSLRSPPLLRSSVSATPRANWAPR